MKKYILLILCMFLLSGCKKENNKETLLPETIDVELSDLEYNRISSLIDLLPFDVESLNVKEFTNQDKLNLAFALLRYENTGENHVVADYSINKTTITEILKKYFGKSITVKMENYMCEYCPNEVLYAYNENTEEFEYTYHGHGYSSVNHINHIVSTKQRGNQYYIEVVKIFAGPVSDIWFDFPTKLYKTAADAYNASNMIIDIKGDNEYCYYDSSWGGTNCDLEKVAKSKAELFNTYVYTFNIEDDAAIFNDFKLK
ncbi:MAG: hypothetical protein E7167_05140 [Firmicutes bacterium]|nr:hypothetical protein [Bacillota bacterium]